MTDNRRCLILFSDNYPLGVGEEFLEQEISYWSDDFDRIIIIPMRSRAGEPLTRRVGKNTEVRTLRRVGRDDWRTWALRHAPSILFKSPKMIEESPLHEPIKWAVDIRFSSIVYETYRRVSQALSSIDFHQYDSVTIYSYWFFTGVGVGELLRRNQLRGMPVRIIARAHAYDVDEDDSPRGYIGSRSFLLDSVDRVYPISNHAAGFLNRRRPDLADKIHVRRLGVPASQRVSRHRDATLWLVSCSHLADYKRVPLIVDAVAELQERGIPVRWTHIGESNPERLEALKTYVQATVPNPNAVELLGHKRNHEVRDLYVQNDYAVFLNCSSGEGVPVSVMEAQAAGLPVVATAAGGTGEIVHDGWNGILLPVEVGGGQIADAITRIAEMSDDEYARLNSNAVEGWRERSDADTLYRSFQEELQEISDPNSQLT